MTYEEFLKFREEALSVTPDDCEDEYYATPRSILAGLLDGAAATIFAQELERKARYEKYLELKAEFEQSES